ncbi:hypothetical protein V8G54_027473 [Vigna mungo]|uniref:Uncharacterized protein n=1 Tax=Vigna mungo TaxID=3915 RepID=A0AAQ3RN39_VIGMU
MVVQKSQSAPLENSIGASERAWHQECFIRKEQGDRRWRGGQNSREKFEVLERRRRKMVFWNLGSEEEERLHVERWQCLKSYLKYGLQSERSSFRKLPHDFHYQEISLSLQPDASRAPVSHYHPRKLKGSLGNPTSSFASHSLLLSFSLFQQHQKKGFSIAKSPFVFVHWRLMAGLAPEGTQFDTRQYDSKMNELLSADGEEFFTSYDEVYDSFDAMGLQENLLRGIYAYGVVGSRCGIDLFKTRMPTDPCVATLMLGSL